MLDGSRFYSLVHDLPEIDWPPDNEDELTQALQLTRAIQEAASVITGDPYVAGGVTPWPKTTREATLERIEREFLGLTAEANLLDISRHDLPSSEASVPEELAKLPAKARDGDVRCVPVFPAAARMSAWGQTFHSASR